MDWGSKELVKLREGKVELDIGGEKHRFTKAGLMPLFAYWEQPYTREQIETGELKV